MRGSAKGSSTVHIIVQSLLGGSPGLSYSVRMAAPWRQQARTAFSQASGRVRPETLSAGMFPFMGPPSSSRFYHRRKTAVNRAAGPFAGSRARR